MQLLKAKGIICNDCDEPVVDFVYENGTHCYWNIDTTDIEVLRDIQAKIIKLEEVKDNE